MGDFVPLTLTGQEPATNMQNGIVGGEPIEALGDGAIENLEAGQLEGGKTGCEKDVAGDDHREPFLEKGSIVPPRAPEPVSKRERRRRKRDMMRKREMARKEFERRRG